MWQVKASVLVLCSHTSELSSLLYSNTAHFLQDPLTYAWLFLSLGFIGYASVFHEVVANHAIDDVEDDQLYYTKIFLDEHKRVSLEF